MSRASFAKRLSGFWITQAVGKPPRAWSASWALGLEGQHPNGSRSAGITTGYRPKKPWPLYNRVGIEQAEIVIATEGEKCANSLIALGFCGTTSPGGAGKAAHTDWGGLLILQGRLKEAEKILRQGLKLFKDDADLHYNLSIALNKQGRKL